jgi:HEAT repeat protein
MLQRIGARAALAVAAIILGCSLAAAADQAKPAPDKAAVDKAFESLKTYDWGKDRGDLKTIDDAINATNGDAAARKDLESRLLAVLKGDAPRAAKDAACRRLSTIGSAESVPALAVLLTDKDLSHMARYALERIPGPEAVKAMRDALPRTAGAIRAGVIGSLGVRRDAESAAPLAAMLADGDKTVAAAAATALGEIGNAEAAKALGELVKKPPEGLKLVAANASLACADRLLADGKKADAIAIYKSLSGEDQPKHVRTAATRGLLAAAGKKN